MTSRADRAHSRAHIAACLTTSCTSGTRQPCLVAATPPQSWTPSWLSPSLTAPTCHLGRTQSELQTPAVGTLRSQRFRVVGVRENVVVGARSCNDIGQSDIEQSSATYYDPVRGWPTDPKWATRPRRTLGRRHARESEGLTRVSRRPTDPRTAVFQSSSSSKSSSSNGSPSGSLWTRWPHIWRSFPRTLTGWCSPCRGSRSPGRCSGTSGAQRCRRRGFRPGPASTRFATTTRAC